MWAYLIFKPTLNFISYTLPFFSHSFFSFYFPPFFLSLFFSLFLFLAFFYLSFFLFNIIFPYSVRYLLVFSHQHNLSLSFLSFEFEFLCIAWSWLAFALNSTRPKTATVPFLCQLQLKRHHFESNWHLGLKWLTRNYIQGNMAWCD